MTTISQARKALQPVLAHNPDLVLMGRFLIIKPVHHMLKGIFLDRSSIKNQFVTSTSVRLFAGPWTSMRGERFHGFFITQKELEKLIFFAASDRVINHNDHPDAAEKVRVTSEIRKAVYSFNKDYRSPEHWDNCVRMEWVRWDIADPASIRLMCEMIEDEVLPDLRKIVSFDDFVTFADTLGWADHFPYRTSAFERMFVATAEGDFEKARALWDSNEQDPDYFQTKELENFMARMPNFHPALLAGDRAALAKIFHDWEEQSVKTYEIEKYWERTPFPLEL
ncbi:hypothetical protein [Phyllobacterium zundukense]|uniref:Uncharacterized protein n=1 Tax=Phyllobacterium zundukense TaxID=1867719 RepID=A0A2N9W3Y0_9HYPH|nr:hypothetical protein [Phyllobacterium zundukense]ATU92078.1 hypothetical protein BLM14_10880 [Phyllobacterium zundukense]PIO46448.1 hypothetical protein B5P45_01185 [Phyllobacterium zundukense]